MGGATPVALGSIPDAVFGGVFGGAIPDAVFGGVFGGATPVVLETCSGAVGGSLEDDAFETSFTGVFGVAAGFFGGVFGADVGIAFFFGGGGIGALPFPVAPG